MAFLLCEHGDSSSWLIDGYRYWWLSKLNFSFTVMVTVAYGSKSYKHFRGHDFHQLNFRLFILLLWLLLLLAVKQSCPRQYRYCTRDGLLFRMTDMMLLNFWFLLLLLLLHASTGTGTTDAFVPTLPFTGTGMVSVPVFCSHKRAHFKHVIFIS